MSAFLSDEKSVPTQLPTEGQKMRQGTTEKTGMGGLVECPRCQSVWGGLKTCHCTACCRTFTGQTAADKHRTGSHARGTRTCLPPAEVGLVDAGRSYPCWALPGTNDAWEGDE